MATHIYVTLDQKITMSCGEDASAFYEAVGHDIEPRGQKGNVIIWQPVLNRMPQDAFEFYSMVNWLKKNGHMEIFPNEEEVTYRVDNTTFIDGREDWLLVHHGQKYWQCRIDEATDALVIDEEEE